MKKISIIFITIILLLIFLYIFRNVIFDFIYKIDTYFENKKIEKMLDENEPEIICEDWFSKHRIKKTYYNSSIVVCSNNEWIRSWDFIKYFYEWNITQKWQYSNDLKEWLRIEYWKDWKEIWYVEYKNWLYDGIYKSFYSSWMYKSWFKEWLWIDWFYDNWQIKEEMFYNHWIKEWTLTWYYENGQIREIINYRNWYFHWNFVKYYENWQILEEWNYKNWLGNWKFINYDENWNIEKIKFYKEGQEYFLDKIQSYSDVIQQCFWEDVIDPVLSIAYSHKEFEDWCGSALSNLNYFEYDKYWLKSNLTEISQLWIDYSEIRKKSDECWLKSWIVSDVCENIFEEENKIIDNIRNIYTELYNILEIIKKENPQIDIYKYFYIPFRIIYDYDYSLFVKFIIDERKSEEQLQYERLVSLADQCMWENILHARVSLSYDEFISNCNYVLWVLESNDFTGIYKNINTALIFITKEWINFAELWKESELLFETDWTIYEDESWVTKISSWSPKRYDLREKEDKNLENFKIHYPRLEKIIERIKPEFEFTPEVDFYIPYSVINDNHFRFTLHI